MLQQEVKIFRDSLHGYIKVPVDYVNNFIDTEVFQRLRFIEQTGMRILYPSARHDRFIHSLGTYFLGHKAIVNFRENVKRSYGENSDDRFDHYNIITTDKDVNEAFWDYCQFLFEIACLLHDCGHSPFSHTLEFHYDMPVKGQKTLNEKLNEYNGSRAFSQDFKGQGSPHERMSALLVCTDFQNGIQDLLKKYSLSIPQFGEPVEFVVRMIIGCKYKQETHINQIKNCLIELLNSNSIDVDSLDYIIRDARLSGVDNMSIDVERLLNSLTLVEITEYNGHRFRGTEISANVLSGTLEGRETSAKLYGNCSGVLTAGKNCTGHLSGIIDVKGSLRTFNEATIEPILSEDKIVSIGGNDQETIPKLKNQTPTVLFGNILNELGIEGSNLEFGQKMNGKVDIEAESFMMEHTFINAKINGCFTGKLLGNFKKKIGSGEVKCRLGYHKSSLSVIQNVILARNYEYQWIYSHHKVVYYSNFLLIDLLRNCVSFLESDQSSDQSADFEPSTTKESPETIQARMFSWDAMINHLESGREFHPYIFENHAFHRITDSDMVALFKTCKLDPGVQKDERLAAQLNEFDSRKYKKSLWKSFAEFNIFFNGFTEQEKKLVLKKLSENSSYVLRIDSKNGSEKKCQYGYLNEAWEEAFESFGLKNIVWVNGDSKRKVLDPDHTYILFKDRMLTYRTVSSSSDTPPVDKLDLFYIYYVPVQNKKENLDGLKDFLHQSISE